MGRLGVVLSPQSFTPRCFTALGTAPKGGSCPCKELRLVMDGSTLDRLYVIPSLRLRAIPFLPFCVPRGWFMVSLDLSDYYLHFRLSSSSVPWMGFRLEGKTYVFLATMFGFKISAYVAAKTSLELAKLLRFLFPQSSSLVWVDNFLLAGPSKDYLSHIVQDKIIPLILSLGFKISWHKSFLIPSTRRVYLGFEIDSMEGRLHLTEKRVTKIISYIEGMIVRLVSGEGLSARMLAVVLGMLTSAAPALEVVKASKPLRSPLRMRRPKWAWDHLVVCPDLTMATLVFLWHSVKSNPGRLYLQPDDLQVMATDASKSSSFTGWGLAVESV